MIAPYPEAEDAVAASTPPTTLHNHRVASPSPPYDFNVSPTEATMCHYGPGTSQCLLYERKEEEQRDRSSGTLLIVYKDCKAIEGYLLRKYERGTCR